VFWGPGRTGSYHQDLFTADILMLDGPEIGFDRRRDDELGWQLPAQGAVRSTVGVFSILEYFLFFICISLALLFMTLVRILPDKYFSVSRVLPHKHVVVTG